MSTGGTPGRDSVACLVLAAGGGRRFGRGGPKQLAPLAGRPLIEHVLTHADAAAVARVVVVLGAEADAVQGRIDPHGADLVVCGSWEEGMSAGLKAGIASVAGCDAAVILLGDQPLITAAAIDRVVAARRPDRDAVRATYHGRPGHPVVLEQGLFAAIDRLEGDAGARSLLAAGRIVTVPCEDVADPLDVDSPADLRAAERALAR